MISVDEARQRVVSPLSAVSTETVSLDLALGRVLAADVISRRTQPPVAVSAMDGYAVRAADVATVPMELQQIGEAPAGGAYEGTVGAGQTVRIFTGGPVPAGADAIVIQENTERDGDRIRILKSAGTGADIREAGLDFRAGDVGLHANRRLTVRDVGLAAAMDVPWLAVRRRPRVAILATGDELVRPGEPIGPNQIVSSNSLAVAAFVRSCGGEAIDLGIARDNRESLQSMAAGAQGADLLITIGGASVGDHDLIQSVLGDNGLQVDFWKVAMRPGKPLVSGRIGDTAMLGLPGNPVSALVCSLLYVKPAIDALLGLPLQGLPTQSAALGADLGENGVRQDYIRATLKHGDDGLPVVTPFAKQDSSMLSRIAASDCLIVRLPHAPAAAKGATVDIIRLDLDPLHY